MEAVQKVADPVPGGRHPLGRSNRVVRGFVQGGGKAGGARSIAEAEEFRLKIHLLRLLDRPHAFGQMAGLDQQVRAGAGRSSEHAAKVVDA